MGIPCYLAMTAAEFSACPQLPPQMGWLSCHFSPSGPGLSNIPKDLPPGSVLILDDSTPYHFHQSQWILAQLREIVSAFAVNALILDFQRPKDRVLAEMALLLDAELPCPVAVPPQYATGNAPIFLPPLSLHTPLSSALAPWHGRELWLDAPILPQRVTVSAKGTTCQWLPTPPDIVYPHETKELHCHYAMEIGKNSISFTFSRNQQDIAAWLEEAESLGVAGVVSLYQEWRQQKPPC